MSTRHANQLADDHGRWVVYLEGHRYESYETYQEAKVTGDILADFGANEVNIKLNGANL